MTLEQLHARLVDEQLLPFRQLLSAGVGRPVLGRGNTSSPSIYVLFDSPTRDEQASGEACTAQRHVLVEHILRRNGIDVASSVYYSYVFKIDPRDRSQVRADDLAECTNIIAAELSILKPRLVICVGRYAATVVVAAHVDAHRVRAGHDEWLSYEQRQELADKSNKKRNVFEERRQIDESIERQRRAILFKDFQNSSDTDNRAQNTRANKRRRFSSEKVDLVGVHPLKGVAQRIYVQACQHVCWAIVVPSPYSVFSTVDAETNESDLHEWIACFDSVKRHSLRDAPVTRQYIEGRIRDDFARERVRPTPHQQVVERFRDGAYEKRVRELYDRYSTTTPLRFQVTRIDYERSLNELEVYGKTKDGNSVYVRVPPSHSERVFHFYFKYPKCWRVQSIDEATLHPHAYPFEYEKNYEALTADHEQVLERKSAELRRRLHALLDEARCKFYTDRRPLDETSNCTHRMHALCEGDVSPSDWTIADEVCDVSLSRCFKRPFRSYDTQEKPRVRVDVKFFAVVPYVVRCLTEMIAEDSKSPDDDDDTGKQASVRERRGEEVKFYEADATPVQRLAFYTGVYVGGWVEFASCDHYEVLTGGAEQAENVRRPYNKHWKLDNSLGIKRSVCDIEAMTFRRYLRGFNPSADLELGLRTRELQKMRDSIKEQLDIYTERFERFRRRRGDAGARRSEKYVLWRQIQQRRMTNIQAEIDDIVAQRGLDTEHDDESHSKLKEHSTNAPLRLLFMDIECITDGKSFPSADHCPIISIVGMVHNLDSSTKIDRETGRPEQWDEIAWFCLGPASPDPVASQLESSARRRNVYCFDSEIEMIRAWLLFRSDRDIDLEYGHNLENFDIPYIVRRAQVLGVYNELILGCLAGTKKLFRQIIVSEMNTFSKAFGEKMQRMLRADGCSFMDTLSIIKKEEKLSSYALNAIALLKFNDKKVELPYMAIPGTFYNDRNRLLVYNEKDVELVARIALQRNNPISSLEFIKLAGVFTQQDVYTRGQQFKVLSAIYRSILNDGDHYIVDSNPNDVQRLLERASTPTYSRANAGNESLDAQELPQYLEIVETLYDSDLDDEDGDPAPKSYSDDSDDSDASEEEDDQSRWGGATAGDPRKKRRRSSEDDQPRERIVRVPIPESVREAASNFAKRQRVAETLASVIDEELEDDPTNAKASGNGDSDDDDDEGDSLFDDDDDGDSDDERGEVTSGDKQRSYIDEKMTAVINSYADMLTYIDSNVKDKSAASKRPFHYKTTEEKNARKRKVFSKEYAGDGKKLTKKQQKAEAKVLRGVSRIDSFFIDEQDAVSLMRRADRRAAQRMKKRRKAASKKEIISETMQANYKGATCIEPRRGFHIYYDKRQKRWVAKFVICCDFSSLYPTVDIGNNIAHDKKLFLRKLIDKNVPIEFTTPSTEPWLDPKSGRDSWVFFVRSDYRPILLSRCKHSTEKMLKLLRMTWYNPHWRHTTRIYRRVLEERGVDVSEFEVDAEHEHRALDESYEPETAHDNATFVPRPKENFDRELYNCGDEFGRYNMAFDSVILQFFEEDASNDTQDHPMRGILPKYLQLCLMARKLVKKQMKQAPAGSALYTSLDGVQMSYKITANSGYGVTGTMTGKLGDYAISASITGYGRRYLEFVMQYFVKGNGKTYTFKYTDAEGNERVEEFTFRGGENFGGDTDSFFNSIDGIDYSMVERMGQRAFEAAMQQLADECNDMLPDPVRLLFEKIMYPLLMVNKKRYAYVDFKRTKIQFKGIECARRDSAPIAREIQIKVLEILLFELDVEKAIEYVQTKTKQILDGELDISNFILSKQYYKTDYKTETLPHLIVIKKKAHRGDPPVEVGERVPYVIIKGLGNSKNSSLNAEDPTYVLEKELQIDYLYYLEKQLKKPLLRVFSRVPGFEDAKKAEQRLFGGLSRRVYKATMTEDSALSRFVIQYHDCVLCGERSPHMCCRRCFDERATEVERHLAKQSSEAADEYRKRIDTCRTCLQQFEGEIQCNSVPCPDFVPRKKAIAGKRRSDTRNERWSDMKRQKINLDW